MHLVSSLSSATKSAMHFTNLQYIKVIKYLATVLDFYFSALMQSSSVFLVSYHPPLKMLALLYDDFYQCYCIS